MVLSDKFLIIIHIQLKFDQSWIYASHFAKWTCYPNKIFDFLEIKIYYYSRDYVSNLQASPKVVIKDRKISTTTVL